MSLIEKKMLERFNQKLQGYVYWFWPKFPRLRLFHRLRLFDSLEYFLVSAISKRQMLMKLDDLRANWKELKPKFAGPSQDVRHLSKVPNLHVRKSSPISTYTENFQKVKFSILTLNVLWYLKGYDASFGK